MLPNSMLNAEKKLWGTANLRDLLEGIGDANKRRLLIGRAEEREADREPVDVTRRHGNVWITCDGGGCRTYQRMRVTVYLVGQSRGSTRGGHDGVESMLVQGGIDACPGEALVP